MKNIILALVLIVSCAKMQTSTVAQATNSIEKVLILDSGLSSHLDQSVDKSFLCENGEQTVFKDKEDRYLHGTNIYSIISKGLDKTKYCIISFKMFEMGDNTLQAYDVMQKKYKMIYDFVVKDKNIKHINMSFSGRSPHKKEKEIIDIILRRGGYVTVAAGNIGYDLAINCNVFPACFKLSYAKNERFKVVGSITGEYSNKDSSGKVINYWAVGDKLGYPVMTGTSQASALTMNILLKNKINRDNINKR